MRLFGSLAAAAALGALTACGGGADDRAAENVEAAGENMAENYEEAADNATNEAAEDRLEEKAEQTREKAEDKAERIDDNDNSAGASGPNEPEANVAGM